MPHYKHAAITGNYSPRNIIFRSNFFIKGNMKI